MIDEKSVRIRHSKNPQEWANGSGVYRGKENAFVYWDQDHAAACINRYPGGEIILGPLEEEKPIEQQRVWGLWLTPGPKCTSSSEAGGMPHWLGTYPTKEAKKFTFAKAAESAFGHRNNPCWNFEIRRLPEMKAYDASKVECFIGGVKVTGFEDISFSDHSRQIGDLRKRAETAEAARDRNAGLCIAQETRAKKAEAEIARVKEYHRVAVERAELAFNRANKAEGALDTLREKAEALLAAGADVTAAFTAENRARHGLRVEVGR